MTFLPPPKKTPHTKKSGKGRIPAIAGLFMICLFSILLYEYFHLSSPARTVIRLHDDQIDMQKFNNEIVLFIIENGYGYAVEKVENTIKEVHTSLLDGDIDISLEIWRENNIVWYEKAVNSGNVVDLGILYAAGRQFWIIPDWFAREKNIKTVFDMKKHWRHFSDPEDPSKGLFFNCIFGWNCRDINKVKLNAYGLDKFFNTVSPSSPEALRAIYRNAMEMHIPVFGYYWQPNALMSTHNWYILEEPSYHPDIWYQVNQAANEPRKAYTDQACAYGDNTVVKMAHKNLLNKAPDVADMFKKMAVDIEILETILFHENRDKVDLKGAVRSFLSQHESTWSSWVTRDAREKILKALDGTP